jgi:hypothetical protein
MPYAGEATRGEDGAAGVVDGEANQHLRGEVECAVHVFDARSRTASAG